MNDMEREVWLTVQALNQAWTRGPIQNLREFFHEDMVAITPMDRDRLEGREACFASWEGFVNACSIRDFKEIDPRVQVYGDAAVVTYSYEITFDAQGARRVEKGRDMFFMTRVNGRWLAVANHFSPQPASPASGAPPPAPTGT